MNFNNRSLSELRKDYLSYTASLENLIQKMSTSYNDHSINVHIESTVIKILNAVYGWRLENTNKSRANFKAIDALDKKNRISLQITSNTRITKIYDTIEKYNSDGQHLNYDKLYFFYIKPKPILNDSQKDKIFELTNSGWQFSEDDLLDFSSILLKVGDNHNRLSRILDVLSKEVTTFSLRESSSNINVGISMPFLLSQKQIDNVSSFVGLMSSRGFHVYLSNNILDQNLDLIENVITVKSKEEIPNLQLCLVILSNGEEVNGSCFLLDKTIEDNTLIQNIALETINQSKVHRLINLESHKKLSASHMDRLIIFLYKKLESARVQNHDIEEIKRRYATYKFTSLCGNVNPRFSYLKFSHDFGAPFKFLILRTKPGSFEQSKNEFREMFPNDSNYNLLVPRDSSHKSDRRIEVLKNLFEVDTCKYISDLMKERIHNDYNSEKLSYHHTFVTPLLHSISDANAPSGLNDIMDWLSRENSPILFLTGPGGVGKTTTCYNIHDTLIEKDEIVLYMDANIFVQEFRNNHFKRNNFDYNIYEIYLKWFPTTSSHSQLISRQSFFANLSEGNIIIILDGIDELISSQSGFDLFDFIRTIQELQEITYLSKIIISVRDFHYKSAIKKIGFYNETILKDHEAYEVQLFTDEMAEEYFNQELVNDFNKIESALEILKQTRFSDISESSQFRYSPYLLFIISRIVRGDLSTEESSELDAIDSKSIHHPLDTVLNAFLKREFAKKKGQSAQLDINIQKNFLLKLAYDYDGPITMDQAKSIFKSIMNSQFPAELIEGLRDHPYLSYNRATEKFDFQLEYLKMHLFSIRLEEVITNETNNPTDLNRIAIYVGPYSSIFKLLVERLSNSHITNITNIIQTELDRLILDQETREHLVSNLFCLQLHLISSKNMNIKKCTQIMKRNFSVDKNTLSGLAIIDHPILERCRLDFSNFIISKSRISNFPQFFENKFSRSTFFFENCRIDGVSSPGSAIKNNSVEFSNFDDKISGDKSHLNYLSRITHQNKTNYSVLALGCLNNVLSSVKQQRGEFSKSMVQKAFLNNGLYGHLEFQISFSVIEDRKLIIKKARHFYVNPSLRPSINNFLDNTFLSPELVQIFKLVKEYLEEENVSMS